MIFEKIKRVLRWPHFYMVVSSKRVVSVVLSTSVYPAHSQWFIRTKAQVGKQAQNRNMTHV